MSIAAACAVTAAVAQGQGVARTVWDGVYTTAQAERGAAVYSEQCSTCHGAEMKAGAGAPSLAGPDFAFSWNTKTADALSDYIRTKMPPTAAGTLTDGQATDLVAAIFKTNGFPAGALELPADRQELQAVTITDTQRR